MRLLNFLIQDLDPYLVDLISVGPQMPQKVVIWREQSTKLTKLQSFAASEAMMDQEVIPKVVQSSVAHGHAAHHPGEL